jgi:hypothetical protein
MDPAMFEWIMHGGVPALSLVLLYMLAKHHIKVLNQHRKDEREWAERVRKLEEAYRAKVEELLKEQIRWVEKISENLAESTYVIETLRDELRSR